MTKPASRTAHSKTTENRIQRCLWPGTSRPWKDRWDLAGPGMGGMWYGEVKESRGITLTPAMKLLRKAVRQLAAAVEEAPAETMGGLFVVLHQVGSPDDWVWLLEGEMELRGPYSLDEFRERWLVVERSEEDA